MYPTITDYRENYVLATTKKYKRIHLGLGLYINTDDPDGDIRTLHNASCQFWSILTLLTINKMHHLIDEANLTDSIQCISTIYDSIYYICKADPAIIEWLNNNLISCMIQDFVVNQEVKNSAEIEIGYNWADLHGIPNNASQTHIQEVLNGL